MKHKRVWVDGCFDVFHFGHANLLRQANELSEELYVGIHSNEAININKGLPVLLDSERYELARHCKYVTKVIEGAPYVTDPFYVQKFDCNVVIHGDDAVADATGYDCYGDVKKMGMYQEVGRTYGISTTNIVGKLLLKERRKVVDEFDEYKDDLIKLFESKKERGKDIVFIDGAFDLFHTGHAYTLMNASLDGDYVLVGLYSDEYYEKVFNELPIMNYKERLLSLLSNKYVDEVIYLDQELSRDFIENNKISKIAHGKAKNVEVYNKIAGKVKLIPIEHEFSYLTDKVIAKRIFDNYQEYYKRNVKKGMRFED